MARMLLCLLATLGCVAALLPAQAASARTLETIVQDDALLMHRPAEQVRATVGRLRALGVDRVRLTANWSLLTREPDEAQRPAGFDARDPGAYDQAAWRGLDQAVRSVRERGLAVLLDVGFWAPHWATTESSPPPTPRARTNIDAQDFADFSVAVARRYSGVYVPPLSFAPPPPTPDRTVLDQVLGGSTPVEAAAALAGASEPLPRVDQFALWNEPNHPSMVLPQWRGAGDAARPASPAIYARMVRAAYPAVKAIRPDARLLLGNTSSDGGPPPTGAVAPLRFLRELACVDGDLQPLDRPECRDYARLPGDGWAHHPYPRQLRPDSRGRADRVDDVRIGTLHRLSALLRRLAERGRISRSLTRLHITEFGYETSKIDGRPTLSQGRQARWLTWAEYEATQTPGVRSFAQFLLRDLPPGPVRISDSRARGFGQYYSGLQNTQGADKVAATTFTAGLFALQESPSTVVLWGRLRLGAGAKAITIERRVGDGPWEQIRALSVDGRRSFELRTSYAQDAFYRLRWPLPGGGRGEGLEVRPELPESLPKAPQCCR